MTLSNSLLYAVALLLLLLISTTAVSAAQLLQEASQGNVDYMTYQAGKFALTMQERVAGSKFYFCRVLGATHRTNPGGDSSEYFLTNLGLNSNGVRAIYVAKVRISTDPDVAPKLDFFLQSTRLRLGPCS